MQTSSERGWARDIPDSLNFAQEQVVFLLGHSLRSLYGDPDEADLPEHLKALALKLEEKYPP